MSERITTEIDGLTLSLSNLDKPLFPSGFTKGELISYYLEMAEVLLPHLSGRPVTRVRFPHGTAEASFYEKNAPAGAPEFVQTIDVATSAGTVTYVSVTQRADLAWLANLAAIELHTPQWRVSEATLGPDGVILEGADEPLATTLVVDLDPGPGVSAEQSAKGAIIAATTLAEVGLEAHPKSSGNKGLQLSVPIAPTPASRVYAFAVSLAQHLARAHPKMFVATMAKEARAGLLFVDFAQNLAARNTIHAYSVRGLEQPSVATPLSWDEVAGLSVPVRMHPSEMVARVQEVGDLWAPTLPSQTHPLLPDPLT
ncbi:MAG: non-homologous end-joining DNA ligase [Propionibacteriaceae bacterium]|nr:non-homologous end-joining DNA ligase [Propionibacteriaceae bacterium]